MAPELHLKGCGVKRRQLRINRLGQKRKRQKERAGRITITLRTTRQRGKAYTPPSWTKICVLRINIYIFICKYINRGHTRQPGQSHSPSGTLSRGGLQPDKERKKERRKERKKERERKRERERERKREREREREIWLFECTPLVETLLSFIFSN